MLEEKPKIMLTKTDANPTLDSIPFPSAIDIALVSIRMNSSEKQRWANIIPLMLHKMTGADKERYKRLPEFTFD